MGTSGLLVMARGSAAQKQLNAAFAERQVHKRYTAVVHGDCRATHPEPWHTIDLPILVDWPRRPLRKIDLDHGKPSTTRWRCLGFDERSNTSRLELEPVTGRSHQLRVHLLALGHPMVGDALYAPPNLAAMGTRLLLHASALAFAHPLSGAPLRFDSPCPF
jgi:tRNA pseudouridine32 synthase/23S rRNA pseudouridine746 synthase